MAKRFWRVPAALLFLPVLVSLVATPPSFTAAIGITSLKWYGGACTGSVDDRGALLATASAAGRITIPAGCTARVASNLTITVPLNIEAGGSLAPASGVTVTLRKPITAPGVQIFTGSGSVVGLVYNRPEWWGANGAYGNTTDSRPAIQAAFNSAKASFSGLAPTDIPDGGKPIVDLSTGFYRICSPIDVYPDDGFPIAIRGRGVFNSGSRIETCPAFAPGTIDSTIVTAGGSGYTSATVSYAGGGGSGAAGTAVIVNGAVVAINQTATGSGYTSNPTVTISGNGTGATAIAGAAMIRVHGIANGSNGVWEIDWRDFQLADYTRSSVSCIRFVPEGSGYGLNSGNTRASIMENLLLQGCPLGLDIVNTLQMRVNRVTYAGIGNNNNTGFRLTTAGTGPTANTGEITFDDIEVDTCPAKNANTCTNTTSVQIFADGQGAGGGVEQGSVAAVVFRGNSIFWGSNKGVEAIARNQGFIGDTWFNPGTQFDGYNCRFASFAADGSSSLISNVNFIGVYNTGTANTACSPYVFNATNGGKTQQIRLIGNQFIMGGAVGTVILFRNSTDITIQGNSLSGNGVAAAAINLGIVTRAVVIGNNIYSISPGTAWQTGVLLQYGSDYVAVTGNSCFGLSGACVDLGSGTHNASVGNVGP